MDGANTGLPPFTQRKPFSASNCRGVPLIAQTLAAPIARNTQQSHVTHLPLDQISSPTRKVEVNRRKTVAVYCSDVATAFDRVRPKRRETPVDLAEQRTAQVVVKGLRSEKMLHRNMVLQDTALGTRTPGAPSTRQDSWKSYMLTT